MLSKALDKKGGKKIHFDQMDLCKLLDCALSWVYRDILISNNWNIYEELYKETASKLESMEGLIKDKQLNLKK